MNQVNRPKEIEVRNSEQELEIEWSDGHRSLYPLYGLRMNCPCVACRGGHGEMGNYNMSYFFVEPPRHVEIKNIKQIGNHAIRIFWDDGHSDGMYQWETLRNLCPCTECHPEEA